MNALGVIDFDRRSISLDAVLYDSRLVGQVPDHRQHGDARELGRAEGVRAVDRRVPPGVQAAAGVSGARAARDHVRRQRPISGCAPSAISRSRRTRCSSAPRSSSSRSAGGFSIAGLLGYDVLIQFDPFAFVADFHASVQLQVPLARTCSRSGRGAAVGAAAAARYAARRRSRSSGAISRSSFDKTLMSGERSACAPAGQRDRPADRRADDARNWSGQLAAGDRGVVTLREPADAAAIALHPLGTLSVKQTVVPLDLDIAKFGNATPADARRFTIAGVRVNGDRPPRSSAYGLLRAGAVPRSQRRREACGAVVRGDGRRRQRRPGRTRFTANGADIVEDETITLRDDSSMRRTNAPRDAPAAAGGR